jgi:hypothetical protein
VNALERRYRRLLAWYPKDHRSLHEEEMIAVLLAGSAAGQSRPTVRDTFDLARGGLSIRLHRAVGPESRGHWIDAFNVAALIGPIVLLVQELARVTEMAAEALRGFSPPESVLKMLAFAAPYGLIAVLAWLRRRKAAAICAWAWLILYTWLVVSPGLGLPPFTVAMGTGTDTGTEILLATAPRAVPICLVAAMLTLAPSPDAGPLGARRLLAWAAVWLAAMVVGAYFAPVGGLLIYVLLIATVAVALRSPIGRRAVIALTPWLAAEIGLVRGPGELSTVVAFTVAILALMAWLARTDRAPSASGSGRR